MKFDYITKGAYLGGGTSLARAQAVRDSLGSGTLTVELRDGETLVYAGTFAGPMTAGGDGSLSADVLLSGAVTTGGTPDAATWTCRIRNADGRYIEGSFGPGGRFTYTAGSLVAGRAVRLTVSIAAAGASSALPLWLQGAALFEWVEVPNSRMDQSPGYSDYSAPLDRPKANLFAYSGMAVKHAGSELFIAGGGHADYAGNEVFSIRLADDAPAWVRRCDPSLASAINWTTADPGLSHYLDGRPASRHTYWHMQFCQQRNLLMFHGGAALWGNGNGFTTARDAYDPVLDEYLPAGTFAGGAIQGAGTMCVVAGNGDVYQQAANGTMLRWVQATAEQTSLGGKGAVNTDSPCAFDTSRNRILRIGRTTAGHILYDASNNGSPTAVSITGPAAAEVPAQGGNIVYCPHTDAYYRWRWGQTDLYRIDAATFEATNVSTTGAVTNPMVNGLNEFFSRFNVCPELKGLVWVQRENVPVRFMRTA